MIPNIIIGHDPSYNSVNLKYLQITPNPLFTVQRKEGDEVYGCDKIKMGNEKCAFIKTSACLRSSKAWLM